MKGQQQIQADKALRVILTTPDTTDLPVFLVGNFNGWKLQDERYRLEKTEDGNYSFTFSDRTKLPSLLEYKYNRGNWETVELDNEGNETTNRLFSIRQPFIEDFVPGWKQGNLEYNPDFLPLGVTISENFEIPQPIKTRRIAALLPYDYETSSRRYPVLYLQDGQNLFDEYAPFGNWAVDKKLAALAEQNRHEVIIVAIDHAQKDRIAEFTPSHSTRLGKGDGMQYAKFLAETLKPYIDKTFRTLPGPMHTGIGGSSMGGLISTYAGFLYPEIYSKLMIFSPSFWVDPQIYNDASAFKQPFHMKIYLYGGGGEGRYMVPGIKKFAQSLKQFRNSSNIEIKISVDAKGRHNESRWGEEFPQALEWLYFS